MEIVEVKVAYVKSGITPILLEVLEDFDNPSMYSDDGHAQYCLWDIVERLDEDSEEFITLNKLLEDGFDYLEY